MGVHNCMLRTTVSILSLRHEDWNRFVFAYTSFSSRPTRMLMNLMCLDMSGYVSGILVLPHFVPPSRCGQLPATLVLDQPERLEVIFCRHTGTWKSRPSVWRIVQRKNFREEVKSRYCSRSSGISASSCFASCNRRSSATSCAWKERMFNWGLGFVWVYIIACWGPLFLYSLCDMKIETGLFSLILRFLLDQQECSWTWCV